MKSKNKKCIGLTVVLFCLATFLTFNPMTANAAAGTMNETEPNNTYTTADRTYDDYDNHGYISTTSDVDWWVISFSYSGPANFFLGSIPVGCDYDLRLYASNGLSLIDDSLNMGNANELITYTVSANTNYYIKIDSWLGSSTTSQYLLRAKVYPSKTLTTVPLYVQDAEDTCGCASGRMILKFYGITVTEAAFKNKATALAAPGDDFTYVYVVKDTINWYLSDGGNSHGTSILIQLRTQMKPIRT